MEIIKVVLSVCVASLGSNESLDSKAAEVRKVFPQSKLALTFKQCDDKGKSIKGKKITYTE